MCVQHLRIWLSSFEEENFQRFALNKITMFKLFVDIISPIMLVAPLFEQTLIIHAQTTTCVKCLRILFISFGEEDFQGFALNLLCSNCLWLLFHR